MRLSRLEQSSDAPAGDDRVPLRSALLWAVVAAALIVGIVLYFKYERQIMPLIS